MPDLKEQKIVVMGGAKGIGKALCETLAAGGAELHILDIEDEFPVLGPKVIGHKIDMTDRSAVARFFQDCASNNIAFDAAVIAAAVHGGCPAEKMPDSFIDQVIDVNLSSHMAFVRELIPQMRPSGRIVAISSNCAEVGIPMEAAYAATKAGLERFYEALAIETSDRKLKPIVVQVGNVNTGFNETGNVYSPTSTGFTDDAYRKVISKIDSSNGMPPAVVARDISRLLTMAKPPFRELIGMNAKKTYWARRLLGTEMSLKLVSGVFGLKP